MKRREKVIESLELAKEKWKISQYEKIACTSSEKEKWKIINDMTNTTVQMNVQPIRHINKESKEVEYLFEDSEILKEMEKYHILKESIYDNVSLGQKISKLRQENSGIENRDIMNMKITKEEVANTFGTCTGAPGPDGFHANLLDKAHRETIMECLSELWNKAWEEGVFLDI